MALKDYRINDPKIKKLSKYILTCLGVANYELSVRFTDSKEILELNKKYRRKNSSTDVLSFPQEEWGKPLVVSNDKIKARKRRKRMAPRSLGDVVISVPNAEKNARKIGHELDREIGFLLVHGILHLCGHDHLEPKQEKKMLAQQKKLMALLSLPKKGISSSSFPLWRECVLKLRHN